VVRIWVMGSVGSVVRGSVVRKSVVRGSVVRGSVVRGPVRVGVMRGRMVRRRRCVGSGLVMAVGRRRGSRVSGGRLVVVRIRVREMGLRVMRSGNDVVGVDGMVRDHVSSVPVGSEVGGRCSLNRRCGGVIGVGVGAGVSDGVGLGLGAGLRIGLGQRQGHEERENQKQLHLSQQWRNSGEK